MSAIIRSTLLTINSADRTPESKSSSDFTYSIGQSVDVSSITIKSLSIPNTQYNIPIGSTILNFKLNGTVRQFNIQAGQYNITEVMEKLQAYINTFGAISSITQNPNTYKVEVVCDQLIQFSTGSFSVLTPLAQLLGLPEHILNTAGLFPAVPSLEFSLPNVPRLQGLINYYILTRVLSQGSNGLFVNGQQGALQTNVPVDQEYGRIVNYRPSLVETNSITFAIPVNLQLIDIKIVDKDLKVVDLNGSEIEFIYKLYLSK